MPDLTRAQVAQAVETATAAGSPSSSAVFHAGMLPASTQPLGACASRASAPTSTRPGSRERTTARSRSRVSAS